MSRRREIGSRALRSVSAKKQKPPSGRGKLSPLIARTSHEYRRNFLEVAISAAAVSLSGVFLPLSYSTSGSLAARAAIDLQTRRGYRRGVR